MTRASRFLTAWVTCFATNVVRSATAERVSPGQSDAEPFVLDEVPDWIDALEQFQSYLMCIPEIAREITSC